MANLPWRPWEGGFVLSVRLTPKSARDEIGGLDQLADGRAVLKVRVRAPPRDGEANDALLRLLAKALHLPLASVRIEAGASGRVKTLRLAGDANLLRAGLAQFSGGGAAEAASGKLGVRAGERSPR